MNSAARTSALALWRWRDGLSALALAALQTLLLWQGQAALLQAWRAVLDFWGTRLGSPGLGTHTMLTPLPSTRWVLGTAAATAALYLWSGQWPERQRPWRVLTRGLCLVQASACAFLLWAPARFPYGLAQHLNALLQLGADLMLGMPLMLALGWGLLRLPWQLKVLGPLGVLAYFAVWLPHQAVLHAWLLSHASVLFMPVLFLCFGLLLNGWLFIALYAWLASLTPRIAATEVRP